MRILRGPQFVAYAHQQIAVAQALLAADQPGHGCCRCARQLPCSVATQATATRQRYQDTLAQMDATVQLPVLAAATPNGRVCGWRRLRGGAQ
jgi:hypothetical protein